MKFLRVSSTALLIFSAFTILPPAVASATGNATVLDWTCIDNSFLPGGIAVVGKSYSVDPAAYRNAKVAAMKFETTRSDAKGKSKITFKNVTIETSKGSYKGFQFAAGIGHTFVVGKDFPYVSNSYTQKLNLSYSATTSKMDQLALSFQLIPVSKEPIYQTKCVQTDVYERMINPGKSNSSGGPVQLINGSIAKIGQACAFAGDVSFSKGGPLSCQSGKWAIVAPENDTVATRAYRSLLERYNAGSSEKPNLKLRIDPAAGDWKLVIANGINAGARLWGTSKATDPAIPAYISERGEYVSEQLKADGIYESPEDAKRNRDAAARGGGQAGSHGAYFDFIFTDAGINSYGLTQAGTHEYTHYSQQVLSHSRTSSGLREFWLDEGCASFAGVNMGGVLGVSQNQRTDLVENLGDQKNKMPLTFFSRGNQNSYSDPRINEVYDTGFIACEALVALKGIDSIAQVYTELSDPSATYETVLKHVYGMSQDSLLKLLQGYLDSVRAGKPYSLNNLESRYQAALE